jgi:hypothetical protein
MRDTRALPANPGRLLSRLQLDDEGRGRIPDAESEMASELLFEPAVVDPMAERVLEGCARPCWPSPNAEPGCAAPPPLIAPAPPLPSRLMPVLLPPTADVDTDPDANA